MILKMITRKNGLTTTLLLLSVLTITKSQDAKSYDTNDWIPIAQPGHNIQKKATGRVLTLPEPAALKFFPEEFRSTRQAEYQQQYLRETSNPRQKHVAQLGQQQLGQQQLGQQQLGQQQFKQQEYKQQQFTPQQLEQYYIDQRKKLSEQRRLQALQDQYQILPSKPYNSIQMQSKLLKQTYDNLPTEFLPPPQIPQQFQQGLPHHYIFPSSPDSVALSPEVTQLVNNPSFNQYVQQPPGVNGTVEFYRNLDENFRQSKPIEITSTQPAPVKEDVQLLYLPIEQLRENQYQNTQGLRENQYQTPQAFVRSKDFQRQTNQGGLLKNIQNDFIQQALQAHKLQQQLEREVATPETVVKKRKPHQPPLALYMNGKENAKVTDVVQLLKDTKSIDVQDTIASDSPHVFVGPANLQTPSGFSKFDLPYLSSIESNRVERKVDQLPFFVAPLNYKTPPGYEKIPFPPPHIGSVIVNMNTLENSNFHYGAPGESVISISTRRPIRQRTRVTTEPAIESTTPFVFNNQGLSPTNSNNQKLIEPQTQFNQNKYFPGLNLEKLREYQVGKTQQIQSPSQENPKQLYNYLEVSTNPSGLYNNHDSSPEKRKPKPTYEDNPKQLYKYLEVGPNPSVLYNNHDSSPEKRKPKPNFDFSPVTPSTTTQPKLEEYIRLVKVSEEMIIRPQETNEKKPDEPIFIKQSKQYLPINSQPVPQRVNYDNLFEAPFVTNSEVNQINSAAKTPVETPQKNQHLKYVVLEEFPVNVNASNQKQLESSDEKLQDEDVVIIKPQSADINDLVDPTIRQLLQPSLLVPKEKSEKLSKSNFETNQKEVITTEEPIAYKITTTTKPEVYRIRGRGRGGSRYNDRTTTSSPRRNPSRTRLRTRVTTTTENIDKDSFTTPRTVIRQRFRTRGRPMITQGYSSTVSNVPIEMTTTAPETEEAVKFEITSFTEGTISKPKLITASKDLSPEEEYLITKYNLPFTTVQESNTERYNVQFVTEKEDVDEKKREEPTTVMDVRSIHKSTEKSRVRQRVRGRTRLTTQRLTTPQPTTERLTTLRPTTESNIEDASVDEFYGFFRPPNFKNKEDATPKILLELTETPRNINDDNSDERIEVITNNKGTAKPIEFIGEILPKYSTTEKYFEITPELTPITEMYVMTTPPSSHTTRRRSRGRYTTKKPIEETESDDETQTNDKIPSRTRGKVHFKLPVIVATTEDDNNYPALYLKAQQDQEHYTPQTSPQTDEFKITVDPGYDDDDQEPHASVLSNNYVPANHVESNPKELKYIGGKHVHFNASNFHANVTTVKMIEVELITEPTEKPKKRGYWKLIKKNNPEEEEFEAGESQNVGVVRNSFGDFETKTKPDEKWRLEDSTASLIREEDLRSTDTPEENSKKYKTTTEDEDVTNKVEITSTNPRFLMDGIRTSTSTSTEISRDAEICSKGVCTKSDDFEQDE